MERTMRERKRLPAWRETERMFRAQRDPKMRVTLPRVTCLDKAKVEQLYLEDMVVDDG